VERFAKTITGHPGAVLLAVGLLSVLAALQIVDVSERRLRIGFDPSVNRLFPADSAREFYEHVRLVFGSDETLVVALVDERNVFTPENLSAVVRLTERFEELEGVHHVTSLANALDMRSDGRDLVIEPFLATIPEGSAALGALADQVLANPIYAGNLVSEDGRATAILVYLEDMTDAEFLAMGLDRRIAAVAEEERGEAEVWITGGALLKAETTRMVLRDVATTMPLIAVAMAVVAAFAYRTVRGVLVPLLTIGIAVLWSMGLVAASGRPLNLVTTIVPGLVMTVAFAYALHVISDYYARVRETGGRETPREVAHHGLAHVALPVVLTGVTTAVGFLALTLSPLEAVREFGAFCMVAVVASVVAALTFAPAVLALLSVPAAATREPAPGGDRFDRAMRRLAVFDLTHRGPVLIGGALVAGLAIWGVTRIHVSMDQITNFPADSTVRRHFEAINHQLQGSSLFYVVLQTDQGGGFKEPVNLREMESLQEWLGEQPEIGGTTSVVDYLKLINRGFHGDDPAYERIPDTATLIAQLLFFGANDELESFVDSRYQTASVVVRSKVADTGRIQDLIRRIETRLDVLPERLDATITGNNVLVTRTIDALSRGQAISLAAAFVLIYGILALLFTSLRVGLLALIPNALPVLAYFGTLGLTGVTLNPTTSLVACLVLGIAVDDTIHYLARFSAEARRLGDERRGAIEALVSVGRPVTFTTVALCLGFLVLTTSDMRNQVEFGALAASTLLVAWVVDVTLTPALASHLRIVTLWDLLSLDLGRDPQHSIPLFRGLRPSQARIVALLMDIRTVPKGHRLFGAGDQGTDMYAVLDGELRVSLPGSRGQVEVATLRRGDAVGEVGLFAGRRSADVEARTEARLLRFEEEDLRVLRRRYPRIGAQVLENLSRILAERLGQANIRTSSTS